ncbi:MAG: signal peptidase I, partial [bacterium]|nr:signal peptidase I [bacterium]
VLNIPAEEIFVMGDNRPRSSDSREFGPVSISGIIGQVFYRYLPATKMGSINNPLPGKLQSIRDNRSVYLCVRFFHDAA